jgi:hypothetical protein
MSTSVDFTVFDRCLDPWFKSLTLDEAKKLADFHLGDEINDRIAVLFSKCNEGDLTDQEREEYSQYVRATNLIGIMKAKARKLLREQTAS